MSLHPDERPQDIKMFLEALIGERTPTTRPRTSYRETRVRKVFATPSDQFLLWTTLGVLVLSLITTLLR